MTDELATDFSDIGFAYAEILKENHWINQEQFHIAELKYESPEDAKRVDDLIASFKNDENLRFAGMKDFWTKFLGGNISKDDLTFTGDAWDWIR